MLVLAVGGAVALILAMLTGSTPLAIVVVALALAGIVQLIRDWRAEHAEHAAPVGGDAGPDTAAVEPTSDRSDGLSPDEFTPDISADPDGPSSDARVDHIERAIYAVRRGEPGRSPAIGSDRTGPHPEKTQS